MELNKALYQRVFKELSKAVEVLENVNKLQNVLDASHSKVEGEFYALKRDYEAQNGKDSFAETGEHDAFRRVLIDLENLSWNKGKIKGVIDTLEEIQITVGPLVEAAKKLERRSWAEYAD